MKPSLPFLPLIEDAIRQGHESVTVDYKGPMAWDEKNKKACGDIIKDLIAFANSDGGFIIVGMQEEPDHSFTAVGVPDDMRRSWEKTRIANTVTRHVEPRISFDVITYPFNELVLVVIQVHPFTDLPHMCVRECEGVLAMTLYVRNEQTESAPVKSRDDMNRILERAVRNRHDRLLEAVRSVLTGAATSPTIPDRQRFEEQLTEAEEQGTPDYPNTWPQYSGYRHAMWCPCHCDHGTAQRHATTIHAGHTAAMADAGAVPAHIHRLGLRVRAR